MVNVGKLDIPVPWILLILLFVELVICRRIRSHGIHHHQLQQPFGEDFLHLFQPSFPSKSEESKQNREARYFGTCSVNNLFLVIQFVTFLGWLSDPFKGLLVTSNVWGSKGHGLNHLVYFYEGNP